MLNDYLAQRLPEKMVVSPEDQHRLNWQDDPQNLHDKGAWQPFQNPEAGTVPDSAFRWPYSSTYQVVVASYGRNQSRWNGDIPRLRQASTQFRFITTGVTAVGDLRMSSVSFPGQKVHVNDSEGRHSGRFNRYYAHEDAKVVKHFFDGSASFRSTRDANRGWNPLGKAGPKSTVPTRFSYEPRAWEAPKTDPSRPERLFGYYRWTRGGLKGVDFESNEINTGQMK